MRIITDSNVLFSALIRDSLTRRLILRYDGFFLFPEYIFEELENHKAELLQKSGMKEEDFNELLQLILQKVSIVPTAALIPFREKAVELVKDLDMDDVLFIACALAYPDSVLWSEDKKLKKQDQVKVLNTTEIMSII